MRATAATELAEARRRAERGLRLLEDAVAAETGASLRRGSWILLTVAFCTGLALAAGRGRSAGAVPADGSGRHGAS